MSDDPFGESQWVDKFLTEENYPVANVAYADLSKKNVEDLLKAHSQLKSIRGIRQILNHHPRNSSLTWPKVERADYMMSQDWKSGYQLLEKYGMNFDLQANPHQLKVNKN